MGTAWLIASGKGGVGKSTLTAALGRALAERGKQVCIMDADIGLRDQDAMLGVENLIVYDVMDVVDRSCGLSQALVRVDGLENLKLLPAAQFARVKDVDSKRLLRIIDRLKAENDYLLIDCPAGIERGLRAMLRSEPDGVIILCTPDDICIRNADRLSSLLRERELLTQLIVNRLQGDLIRTGTMYTAATVAQTLELPLSGEIPEDPAVYRALLTHHSMMETDGPAAQAVRRIAARLCGESTPLPGIGTEPLPWYKRLFSRKEALRT